MNDPYRTPAQAADDTPKKWYESFDLEAIDVTVFPLTDEKHIFKLEGDGPPPGMFYEKSDINGNTWALERSITTATKKLRRLLENAHSTGFMEIPGRGIIIPEARITRISRRRMPTRSSQKAFVCAT